MTQDCSTSYGHDLLMHLILQGMITKWIKDGYSKDPPYPNWRQLLAVVAASYGGGNPALAKDLAEEHIKG